MELDLLDKKILYLLNYNPRFQYSKIAKLTKTSKEVISYRVKRLENLKIIEQYLTSFNFGYQSYKILMSFGKLDNLAINKINQTLNISNINWITTCTGSYDLIFVIMAKNQGEFDKIFNKILKAISKYIRNYDLVINYNSILLNSKYFLDIDLYNSIQKKLKNKKQNHLNQIEIRLDFKDKLILKCLETNARISLTEIAKQTNLQIDTIKYRLKKLEKNNIVKNYRMIINSTILNFNRYEILVKSINLNEKIINNLKLFVQTNLNIEYFSQCEGKWNLEFTVYFKNNLELREFIIEIKKRFGEYIEDLTTLILFETLNYNYYPKELD